jgi:hypothetical protein
VSYREWRDKHFAGVVGGMDYWQFRRQCTPSVRGFSGTFWDLVDANWAPAEQDKLAREWKEGSTA